MNHSAKPPIFAELDKLREELKALGPIIATKKLAGEDVGELVAQATALKASIEEVKDKLPNWREDSNRPPIDECIPGRLYSVRCRSMGPKAVYLGHGEFIGLQLNFGTVCLFTEYHWDNGPPYGTVFEAIDTGIDLPDDVPLSSSPGSIDEYTGRWVGFSHYKRKWYFTDTGEFSDDIKPVGKSNEALYDWLWEQGAVAKHWKVKD